MEAAHYFDYTRHKPFFDDTAKTRDAWKARNKYYWRDLERFCAALVPEDASVLEIGCGTGDLIGGVKSSRRVGIDFSESMIAIAREKYPDVEFRTMAAEEIEFDEQFDYVILSNTIGYLEDIQRAFEALLPVLGPQSKIVVTYHSFLWQPVLNVGELIGLRAHQPQQNWLARADIENLMRLAGLEPYKSGNRTLLPKYIPLLTPLLNRYVGHLPLIDRLGVTGFVIGRPAPSQGPWTEQKVSVVVPARNESGNIQAALDRTPVMGLGTELIFVEGNSTDDTRAVIEEACAKYEGPLEVKWTVQEGKGKGDAVRKGYAMATGDIYMILDADLTVPPEDLPKFYEAIASGHGEFINGSRLVYNMDRKAMRFLNLLGNKFFGLAFTWLLDQRFKDTLCGTKVISRADYKRLERNRAFFGDFDPFGDFDLIFGASKLNLKIVELPIRYRERTYGDTNISRFRHGMILLRMCAFASRKIKFV